MKLKFFSILFFFIFFLSCKNNDRGNWKLFWVQPNNYSVEVISIASKTPPHKQTNISKAGLNFFIETVKKDEYLSISATANLENGKKAEGYFSLRRTYSRNEIPFNFNGIVDSSEIYRQSPHDVNAWIVDKIPMQAMPVVAVKNSTGFEAAFSDSPAMYKNFSSQEFNTKTKTIYLNSGDNGTSPGIQPDNSSVLNMDYNAEKTQIFTPGKVEAFYHKIYENLPHIFKAVILQSEASDLNRLRKDIIKSAASNFSETKITDFYGALAFATAYFNLRTNDSGKSKYWVVPAVEYANQQYGRDAFWISTMLPSEYAAECLKSELVKVNHFAEYPLFAIIWAYRSIQEGFEVDLTQVQAYVDAVEKRVRNNQYYSYFEEDGRLDFQYWGDVMAFEKDDIIAYNQGLFAVSMQMASELNLIIKTNPQEAKKHYQNLFNTKLGFMPVSRKKAILSPDALVPDLLSQIYLNKKLLSTDKVQQHFNRMVKYSKTPFGFKIVATPDGKFLPAEAYDIEGYESQVNREKMPDGRYFRGGSYFLYDNLFLLDAFLHNIEGAEELLKWRISLDFEIGATTYECLNTISGEPWKPNMGWNVAIYAFWRKLMDEGKASNDLLLHIDNIVNQ